MTNPATILSTILGAVAVVVVGWMTGRATRRVAAIEGATPAYTELDARVQRLEVRVLQLESERDIDRAHIGDVHAWDDYGRPGRIPTPPDWYRARWTPPREDVTG